MARTWTVALLAATLLPLASAAPQVAMGEGSLDLQCGSLSPFSNHCADPDRGVVGAQPSASAGVLGFVGRIVITLVPDAPPYGGSITWVCTAPLGSEQGSCGSAVRQDVAPGTMVRLECVAEPTPSAVASVPAGPIGPWGCKVLL